MNCHKLKFYRNFVSLLLLLLLLLFCAVQALSVIDNVLIVTVFPLYFLPTFVDYTSLYTDYEQLSAFHQFVLVYVLPVAFVAQTATIWVTVLVAVNRYIAVCRPYQVVLLF